MSHLAAPRSVAKPILLGRPFSSYHHVDRVYGGPLPIRRLFAQSRMLGGETLLVEEVPAEGLVREENEQIRFRHPGYQPGRLHRLTFWRQRFTAANSTTELKS